VADDSSTRFRGCAVRQLYQVVSGPWSWQPRDWKATLRRTKLRQEATTCNTARLSLHQAGRGAVLQRGDLACRSRGVISTTWPKENTRSRADESSLDDLRSRVGIALDRSGTSHA